MTALGVADPAIRMPTRTLGRTSERVSLVGLGGFHVGTQAYEQESIRIIQSAIDRGVTFLDNCWDYNDGESERRMGKALRGGYRDKAFLMTKLDGRTRQAAAAQLDESLRRLETDRIDLVQIHEVIRDDDPARCFADDGCVHALLDARQAGKVRYIGFTGHKDPSIHLAMLRMADDHAVHFDTVQMPLNVMDAHFRSFEEHVVPVAIARGIAVLGMKPLASGVLLKSGTVSAVECLHYAMNLPVSVVITGCDSMWVLDQAVDAALTFEPMASADVRALLDRTRAAAEGGEYERFKTTPEFDATALHPEWLGSN